MNSAAFLETNADLGGPKRCVFPKRFWKKSFSRMRRSPERTELNGISRNAVDPLGQNWNLSGFRGTMMPGTVERRELLLPSPCSFIWPSVFLASTQPMNSAASSR